MLERKCISTSNGSSDKLPNVMESGNLSIIKWPWSRTFNNAGFIVRQGNSALYKALTSWQ